MKSKLFLLFLLFSFTFSLIICDNVQAKDPVSHRKLEIIYPEIPGAPKMTTTEVPLPEYISYIFRFVIVILGFIIFGVLIYNGILYLTSAGRPTQLSEAKSGILAGLLGGLLLLGGVLLFNTINIRLVTLEPPKITSPWANIPSGIYLCKKKVDSSKINEIINNYKKNPEESIKAAKEFIKILDEKTCINLSKSYGSLANIEQSLGFNPKAIFVIPQISPPYEKDGKLTVDFSYDWAIIFHEKVRWGQEGKCKVLPSGNKLYRQFDNLEIDLGFRPLSLTLIRKPLASEMPTPSHQGITLYEGFASNTILPLEKADEKNYQPAKFSLRIDDLTNEDYKKEKLPAKLIQNVRSIEIEPTPGYIAVLYGIGEHKCSVRADNDSNLTDDSIGRCGPFCEVIERPGIGYTYNTQKNCKPCVESVAIIKGIKQ